jgi:hypothetical protein
MGEEILQVVSIVCEQGNLEVEPARGFEPLTFRLQGGCSTAELRRHPKPHRAIHLLLLYPASLNGYTIVH